MSVINKMLRDLDRRQSGVAGAVVDAAAPSGFTRDTRVVSRSAPGERRGSSKIIWLGALLLLAGAAAWRYQTHRVSPPTAKVTGSVTAVPRAARMAASEAAPVAARAPTPAPETENQPLRSPTDFALKMDDSLRSPVASVPRYMPVAPLAAPATRTSAAQAAVALPAAAPAVLKEPPVRRAGADEVLAQAQSLWQRGSHEAAIDLLAEALLLAERSHAAGAPSGSTTVLLALARELGRMELAQGRVSQALARLTRLEPILPDAAEIWALRGNAAQRLGRHAESAAAYSMALKLGPDEPRWLQGAAVSLAAQGNNAAAAELAQRASALGGLSPDVANYLRQLGVKWSER